MSWVGWCARARPGFSRLALGATRPANKFSVEASLSIAHPSGYWERWAYIYMVMETYEARARLCLLLGRGARLPAAPVDAIASPGFAVQRSRPLAGRHSRDNRRSMRPARNSQRHGRGALISRSSKGWEGRFTDGLFVIAPHKHHHPNTTNNSCTPQTPPPKHHQQQLHPTNTTTQTPPPTTNITTNNKLAWRKVATSLPRQTTTRRVTSTSLRPRLIRPKVSYIFLSA